MPEIVYIVPEGIRRDRADKILAAAFPGHSRAAFQRAIAAGRVTRAGVALDKRTELRAGDVLNFSLLDETVPELKAVEIPLAILYEDEQLLVVNKPAGMVVHPGAGTGEDTLVHALLAHCGGHLSRLGGEDRPGIVHRLDRETSGAILVAKTDSAHRKLAKQFAERTVQKHYLAIVEGRPPLLSGSITSPIGRHPQQRHKMAVVAEDDGGRAARTDWTLVECFQDGLASLVRCAIHTGRTHQIRVHLKSIGHRLLGDTVYGWRSRPHKPLPLAPPRVMLHAEQLEILHPATRLPLIVNAPIPTDFQVMLEALRKGTT